MTSTAYRQSSRRSSAAEAVDPDNRLLGRMPVRRLEAEAVRDAMLAVSGKFNAKVFGKPVPVKADDVGQIIIGVDNLDEAGDEPARESMPLAARSSAAAFTSRCAAAGRSACWRPSTLPAMEPNCDLRNGVHRRSASADADEQ